jgi:GT2 family glycosyltransferase
MGDLSIFDEPHHQSLELLSARALANGDIPAAFRYADRRCRIPPLAEPHCFVLRAEALFRMGEKTMAISDLDRALAIAPEDVAANRRMLAWSDGRRQCKAARVLVARDRDVDVIAKAIKALRNEGQESFASVTVLEDSVEGWTAWVGDGSLDVSITGGGDAATASFEPDPFHPLSGRFLRAVGFNLARPKSREPQSVHLSIDGEVFHSIRAPGNESDVSPSDRRPRTEARAGAATTVIVPVYADYEATKACLESLLACLAETAHRTIVVDDATPDDRIARYLSRLAAKPGVQVLTNPKNLGFVGAINRALDQVDGGDVVLLNADTIVPAGFIERLAAAAHSSPDIGTVTPLSNNGEFTSFPVPNRSNPLQSDAEITRLDEIAARVNAGRIVDIPNGIGFCLYVTRACFDAVGALSESYHRGYLEDVDFCLRAREAGLRNVCAPSVYVGHAGSRSFKEEKRSLVMRNLDVIARRFPKYRAECAAFIMADPLRASREAIERAAPSRKGRPRVMVTGMGTVGVIVRERARHLSADDKPVVILEVGCGARGLVARLQAADGAMPQSIRFDLSTPVERRSMLDYLRQVKASRIEIADPANVPESLVDLLVELDVPYDMFIADAGLMCPPAAPMSCEAAAAERSEAESRVAHAATKDWQHYWRAVAKRADRILVPCDQAGAFADRIMPKRKAAKVEHAASHRFARPRGKARFDLGLVPLRLCPQEQRLMRDVALQFRKRRPEASLLVLGATSDDIALLHLGNTFVTGPVQPADMEGALRGYGPHALFLCATRPLFGHPVQLIALNAPMPVAYFDWSAGRCDPRPDDLAIDPRAAVEDIVAALDGWI